MSRSEQTRPPFSFSFSLAILATAITNFIISMLAICFKQDASGLYDNVTSMTGAPLLADAENGGLRLALHPARLNDRSTVAISLAAPSMNLIVSALLGLLWFAAYYKGKALKVSQDVREGNTVKRH